MVDLSKFSLIDTGHTTTQSANPYPFNFVSHNGANLVVTVGDSWTWGADMTPDNNDIFRIQNHFGMQLSKNLDSDWLGLGQNGSGNFWIYDKICELADLIPQLEYQHIYVVCTLTETGRAINSRLDIDFYRFFLENHCNDLISFLNNRCVDNIIQVLSVFDNVSLHMGTNFVDYLGHSYDCLMPKPWLELICNHHGYPYYGNCQVVSPAVIQELEQLKSLVPDNKLIDYWQFLNNLTEQALQRERMISTVPGIKKLHPSAHSHSLWADYILQNI